LEKFKIVNGCGGDKKKGKFRRVSNDKTRQ